MMKSAVEASRIRTGLRLKQVLNTAGVPDRSRMLHMLQACSNGTIRYGLELPGKHMALYADLDSGEAEERTREEMTAMAGGIPDRGPPDPGILERIPGEPGSGLYRLPAPESPDWICWKPDFMFGTGPAGVTRASLIFALYLNSRLHFGGVFHDPRFGWGLAGTGDTDRFAVLARDFRKSLFPLLDALSRCAFLAREFEIRNGIQDETNPLERR